MGRKELTTEEKLLLYKRDALLYHDALAFYSWSKCSFGGWLFSFVRGLRLSPPAITALPHSLALPYSTEDMAKFLLLDAELRKSITGDTVIFYRIEGVGVEYLVIGNDAHTLFQMDNSLRPLRLHVGGDRGEEIFCFISSWCYQDLAPLIEASGLGVMTISPPATF